MLAELRRARSRSGAKIAPTLSDGVHTASAEREWEQPMPEAQCQGTKIVPGRLEPDVE